MLTGCYSYNGFGNCLQFAGVCMVHRLGRTEINENYQSHVFLKNCVGVKPWALYGPGLDCFWRSVAANFRDASSEVRMLTKYRMSLLSNTPIVPQS